MFKNFKLKKQNNTKDPKNTKQKQTMPRKSVAKSTKKSKKSSESAQSQKEYESEQFVVEAIIGHIPKHVTDRKKAKELVVKWEGFSESDNSNEPVDHITGLVPEIVDEYWALLAETRKLAAAEKKKKAKKDSAKAESVDEESAEEESAKEESAKEKSAKEKSSKEVSAKEESAEEESAKEESDQDENAPSSKKRKRGEEAAEVNTADDTVEDTATEKTVKRSSRTRKSEKSVVVETGDAEAGNADELIEMMKLIGIAVPPSPKFSVMIDSIKQHHEKQLKFLQYLAEHDKMPESIAQEIRSMIE